jgi:hypothetical protein
MPTIDDRIANLERAAANARAIARTLRHRNRTVLASQREAAAEAFEREAAVLKRVKQRQGAPAR